MTEQMYAVHVADDEEKTLTWEPCPRPSPGPGQVLVKTMATALNRADLLQRRGLYPPPPGASEIMGLEAAGEIVACGEGVEAWSVGDHVCALLEGGGYAEYFVRDARLLLPRPKDFSWAETASLPEVYYTAYLNLKREAGLQPGERVLVHAGASGVGTAAIQLCQAWGNPVLATASGLKLKALYELGADMCFDRHEDDFFDAIASHTWSMPCGEGEENFGVDVILDPVGASYLKQNLSLLRLCGRLVLIGLMGGAKAELSLAQLLRRRLRVMGSVLRARSREEKIDITQGVREDVWPLFEQGALKPVIHQTLSIHDVAAAHDLMASNHTVGKIVLHLI